MVAPHHRPSLFREDRSVQPGAINNDIALHTGRKPVTVCGPLYTLHPTPYIHGMRAALHGHTYWCIFSGARVRASLHPTTAAYTQGVRDVHGAPTAAAPSSGIRLQQHGAACMYAHTLRVCTHTPLRVRVWRVCTPLRVRTRHYVYGCGHTALRVRVWRLRYPKAGHKPRGERRE